MNWDSENWRYRSTRFAGVPSQGFGGRAPRLWRAAGLPARRAALTRRISSKQARGGQTRSVRCARCCCTVGWTRRSIGRSGLRGGWPSRFGARLHVLYTVEDPLSAGWTAEVSADRMPEVHEAMEIEARQRLSSFISEEDQERLDVQIALGTGPADEEMVRYANEQAIDLAIVQAQSGRRGLDGVSRRPSWRRARAPFSSCADGCDRAGAPGRGYTRADGFRWRSKGARSAGSRPIRAASFRSTTSGSRSGWRGCGAGPLRDRREPRFRRR